MTTTPPAEDAPRGLPQDVLHQLTGAVDRSALDALREVKTEETALEGFRPISECLEWRLADAYWDRTGVLPFVRNDVPYLVNNTGRLSENAAALVFAALTEGRARGSERITVLELGAGTGLAARYFLDAMQALCRAHGSDLYDRLTYVVTDRAQRTVAGWRRDGLFAGHEGHVRTAVCDAAALALPARAGGEPDPIGSEPPAVVFCNYLLDVLPSTIARRAAGDGGGLEQLEVRAHLRGGAAALRDAGLTSLDEARALAASGQPSELARLLPLLPHLDLETAYLPWTPAPGAEAALAATIGPGERAIVSSGALTCLRALLRRIADGGFVLINDYGPVRPEDVAAHVGVQRFGGSVALGLNFSMLERALAEDGFAAAAPPGDEQRRVHTRVCARRIDEPTREALQRRFSLEADRYLDAPQEEARGHVAAGRQADALAAYRAMIERNPGDWQMLGEAAEYVGLQLRDHAAGLPIVRAALERNPWYSSWLWNILGDCFYYADKIAEAHRAFEQAARIDPDDPRTNLNLAYTFSSQGSQAAALAALARGLANDGRGTYRTRLLEKQAQVLSLVSERTAREQERLGRRAERFR